MNCLSDWNCRMIPYPDPLLTNHDQLQTAFSYCVERFEIKRFCLMPEYDSLSESVSLFLLRQERIRESLLKLLPKGACARIGASVLLQPDLHETMHLRRLCLRGSRCLPIQLPIGPYEDWMDLELNRLLYRAKHRLLFLSFDRFPILYPTEVLERLTRIPNAVYQFNYRSLADPRSCALLNILFERKATVLFGTGIDSLEKLSFYELDHYLEMGKKTLSVRCLEELLHGSHLFWNA